MSNSISDWNIIDSKQMILDKILENNKKLDLIITKFEEYDTKLEKVNTKIDSLNNSINKLSKNNLDFNDLNNFKQQNNGLKELVNSDLSRIKNNIWRQSNKNNLKKK